MSCKCFRGFQLLQHFGKVEHKEVAWIPNGLFSAYVTVMAGADSISTATSLEDHTEDFDSADNPTRDTLAEGLLCLIKPTIDRSDQLHAELLEGVGHAAGLPTGSGQLHCEAEQQ